MGDDEQTLETPKECPSCGVDLRPQDRYCFNCGRFVLEVLPPTTVDDRTGATSRPDLKSELKSGGLFAEKFRIKSSLGSGGMGLVYLVEEEATRTKFALKILKPEISRDAAAKSRFQREIRILARIRHPAIPRIVEWGSEQDSIFFITEFIAGQNLGELLAERGVLPWERATALIVAVAEALASAHQAGVVHRDIKPSNIMVDGGGAVHLIDFGVARLQQAEATRLTESGLFVGTPQYMAPEQINSHYADERSDIYSLGVVYYQLLTGELPFTGDTPMAIASKHQREPPPSPRGFNSSIPFRIERSVLRCLEKEPGSRYWTANEFLADLRRSDKGSRIRRRALPNGDTAVEDPAQIKGYALEIASDVEKAGWSSETAIYYRDFFYKLKGVRAPDGTGARWRYLFDVWPENEIMRRVIDYEAEAAMQGAATSIFSRAKKWMGGRASG